MTTGAAVLQERLGAAAIDARDLYRFAAAGVLPACVLQPATVEEVGAAVQAARAEGLAIVPAGNGHHLDVGFPPRRYDAALSTRRLTRIIAHAAADMTVTVEAGVTLASLARMLSAAGQWLPLDPARGDDTTIGGLIAADRSGPLRCGFGKVRDWLLGVTVIGASGSALRGGGRVVKNVAGYDLPKLFTGSFGTLGVIVEATLKVHPLPEQMALFVWPCATFAEALAAAERSQQAAVWPVLLEAVNDAAAESLGLDSAPCLVLGVAGSAGFVTAQERQIDALSSRQAWRIEPQRYEAIRRALSDFSHPANEDGLVVRVSTRPAALAAVLLELEAAAAERRTVVEIAAHAGNGVAWCQLLGAPDPATLAGLARWLRDAVAARGGHAVFEAIPAELRAELDPWGIGEGPLLELMAGVKRTLDPEGLFSPGRFVGRL